MKQKAKRKMNNLEKLKCVVKGEMGNKKQSQLKAENMTTRNYIDGQINAFGYVLNIIDRLQYPKKLKSDEEKIRENLIQKLRTILSYEEKKYLEWEDKK